MDHKAVLSQMHKALCYMETAPFAKTKQERNLTSVLLFYGYSFLLIEKNPTIKRPIVTENFLKKKASK